MGFTLKRTLDLVGRSATVEVAELVQALVEWNEIFLVEHNGPVLEDDRTRIYHRDLLDRLAERPRGHYDAVLLDIDNTPDDLITSGNARLNTTAFLATLKRDLAPREQLAYWLSEPAPAFKSN